MRGKIWYKNAWRTWEQRRQIQQQIRRTWKKKAQAKAEAEREEKIKVLQEEAGK